MLASSSPFYFVYFGDRVSLFAQDGLDLDLLLRFLSSLG
jgi:hypothetical protein